ncbi:MAG: asparagine synthase (glutamine-hydrolyzing) [Candidatus Promineifilaceae bacterium]
MCGICGLVSWAGPPPDEGLLRRMGHSLRHRGPDDDGIYLDQTAGLACRRLSIIDLQTGRQPIGNEDGSLWLAYNGEVYNYRPLRAELERRGHIFRSLSDSEVVLHAYEEYGPACLERFNGMFAFAIWVPAERRLFLARDRLGIKPLYYWAGREELVFGSELKAILVHPAAPRELNLSALDHFLALEYIPGPQTIFNGIHKLPAGHWLLAEAGNVQLRRYWDVAPAEVAGDERSCAEQLTSLLDDAVRLQMVSDVPIGAFLSGGLDSGAVLASMSRASPEPVRAFSIGFDDASYNELPYARLVARACGARHEEAVLAPDIAALAAEIVCHLDEPFADFSLFPTYLVSKLARQSVKVVLSGDGGDELFAGYDTYVAQQMDRYYRWLPGSVRRRTLPAALARVPPRPAKKGLVNRAKRFVEGAGMPAAFGHARWMIFMSQAERAALFRPEVQSGLYENGRPLLWALRAHFEAGGFEGLARQQYVDLKSYLVDDILTKVDRMSMAVSLEARVPLLDHRLVEFALNLPPHMKLRRGRTKALLRRAMAGRLPPEVLTKPKQGFSIPLKHWLRGPLRPLMRDLLAPDSLRRGGIFEPATVGRWLDEHSAGRANHSHKLWALMVFELWRQGIPAGSHAAG